MLVVVRLVGFARVRLTAHSGGGGERVGEETVGREGGGGGERQRGGVKGKRGRKNKGKR